MTTYSIQLDDLDLALLPIQRHSSNHFLKKEFFEFQLLVNKADPPVYIQHPCHICAIDVPAAFWSAHCASAKHRANARIATVAAQRMSALIGALPPPHTPLATEQFCDSCTCIAEEGHEETKEHKLSEFQDRMLCDLAMMYTGDDIKNENEKKDTADAIEKEYMKRNVRTATANLNGVEVITGHSQRVENATNIQIETKSRQIASENSKVTPKPNYAEMVSNKNSVAVKENATNTRKQSKSRHIVNEISEVKAPNYAEMVSNKNYVKISVKETENPTKETENPEDASTNSDDESFSEHSDVNANDASVSSSSNDENEVHYPFVKELLEVRCVICDRPVPSVLHARVTHLMGRRHEANANKLNN